MTIDDLISRICPHLRVLAVNMTGSENIDIILESSAIIDKDVMDRVSYELKSAVSRLSGGSGKRCHVEFRFQDALHMLLTDENALNTAKTSAVKLYPVLGVVFSCSRLIAENGLLCLYVPEKLMEAVASSLEKYIRQAFFTLYGIKRSAISIYSDTSLKLPAAPAREFDKKALKRPVQTAQKTSNVILGRAITKQSVPMCDIGEDAGRIIVKGFLESYEEKPRRTGGSIVNFSISDHTYTIPVKLFLGSEDSDKTVCQMIQECGKKKHSIIARGDYRMDTYTGQMCLFASDICWQPSKFREDTAKDKRVELHLHTQYSAMDALLSATDRKNDAVETAARFGHSAVAITDHGVVHGFPSAVNAAKAKGIKAILGVEGYLIDDSSPIEISGRFIVLSFELIRESTNTTVELLAKTFSYPKTYAGDELNCCFTYGVKTALEDDFEAIKHVLQYGTADSERLSKIAELCTDHRVLVHDANIYERLTKAAGRFNTSFPDEHIDTRLLLHHLYHDELKDTSLNSACEFLGIDEKNKTACLEALFIALTKKMEEIGASMLPHMHGFEQNKVKGHGHGASHIVLLSKNAVGLKSLYKLVSWGHLEYLKGVPRIPRSLLMLYRNGMIIGSACEAGELFSAVLQKKLADPPGIDEKIRAIASFYDYLEIQPIGNNEFLMRDGRIADKNGLRDLNRSIVALGEELDIPVAATGDVHFLEPTDAIFRTVLMTSKGFSDADKQAPLYFKTTDEMLEEFSYLGEEKAYEVVVKNTNMIADSCDALKPFLSEKHTYAPTIEGAVEELSNITYSAANSIYGNDLPPTVSARLDKELRSIIGNDYCSLYLMAMRLVKKSLSDGYLVGSRGSVGSSFVAYLMGITEVNSLPPHYVCPSCKYSDFNTQDKISRCGIDMPDKSCPKCGAPLTKLGYDIPFETFLGFKGDKTPDIDLNFSGVYQPVAHAYVEEMFGEGHAFRAGTISAVQEKTAYGYVKKYCEEYDKRLSEAEMLRLARGCSGVKRTTGQHPGGIVIVPKEYDIYDFTPVQYPADKECATSITTHFDFHAMDDRLVKLDILGHDDPTALRMLHDITGIDPKTIPLDDKGTMALFSSLEPLGIDLDKLNTVVGSIAIPEFGTRFVRQMLKDTRPTTMEELVRIAGLSHGTDVWLGNAQDLVKDGSATLSEAICTRDDIMNYLIAKGGEPSMSFKIMESVRKGKGLTPEMEQFMMDIDVPAWYIDSCKKIKYMFPRAHAAAYVMMSFRVAYYKLHHPEAFYATFFTVRADAFDLEYAFGGAEKVLLNINALQKQLEAKDNAKIEDTISVLEVVYEMNLRGIDLLPLDLYKSRATEFIIEDGAIRPPFTSLSGIGETAAKELWAASADGHIFLSVEDFMTRSHANNTIMQQLRKLGLLDNLPERNQLTLFDALA